MSSQEATKASKPGLDSVPIELLNNDIARIYTHVHPILVLTVYYVAFSSTVADPVTSLAYLLIPLALLQAFFVCICVPQALDTRPTNPNQTTTANKTSPQHRRKQKPPSWHAHVVSVVVSATLSIILSLSLTTVPLFIILVLHGAPLTTHLLHTLLLAAHLALLSAVPLFYAHGVSSLKWRELYSIAAPVDELLGAAIGALLGAWIGAIPIPLDWDREWQKWPVTVCTGAYGGWAVGKLLGGTLLKGKRIEFGE